jgi:hypothetical protein
MNDFQKEFLRWLDQNRSRFAVAPFFNDFDGRELRFYFDHVNRG